MQIKNVAVGATLLWQDVARVSIHAFGQHLWDRGCNVAWWTMPLSPLHLLSVAGLYRGENAQAQRRRFDAWRASPDIFVKDGAVFCNRVAMTAAHPSIGIPLLKNATTSRNYLRWRVPSLMRRMSQDGIAPLDMVFFDAGGYELFYPFRNRAKLSVYRVNDIASEFIPQVASRKETEEEVFRQADMLFCVSQSIVEQVVSLRGTDRGVYYLPNGFDDSLFGTQHPLPSEYETIPGPRAVLLAGILTTTYDWDLILATARCNPGLNVCIVGDGPTPPDMPANIHILGHKAHEDVPGYLQHADVGIIPYRNMVRSRRAERPLKFYEYLAAGLPIVAVPYGGMKVMGDYATLADTPKAFADAVRDLAEPTTEQRVAQRAAAVPFAWRARLAEFDAILASQGITYAASALAQSVEG